MHPRRAPLPHLPARRWTPLPETRRRRDGRASFCTGVPCVCVPLLWTAWRYASGRNGAGIECRNGPKWARVGVVAHCLTLNSTPCANTDLVVSHQANAARRYDPSRLGMGGVTERLEPHVEASLDRDLRCVLRPPTGNAHWGTAGLGCAVL